jgi:uncharacterized protein (DUF4415 family)
MTKTNPLVKKGTPKFPTKPENNKENHEQLEHPETKNIPETKVNTNTGTNLEQFYNPPEKIEKKQVSIYLDTDVIEAFNEFGKQQGKGAKSDLVNNFLKQVFNIRQDGAN